MLGTISFGGELPKGAEPLPRLTRAAHEFEGQMMKELLKPMTNGSDDDCDDGQASSGALGEFAGEALGRALSERGGFGIADRIVRELSRSGTAHGNGTQAANQTVED